ncbi:MAG: DUF3343 domain-containing protein [Clostridia bacterium]|nr:DUF3343 domain-containing protein [Clostridia bacterium]
MANYYIEVETRAHAFLLQRRMESGGVQCEITYMPREIMTSLCNMGVRFDESELEPALALLRRSGLPGCRLYREDIKPNDISYTEVEI